MRLEIFLVDKKVDQKLSELILFFDINIKMIRDEFLKNHGMSDGRNIYRVER